MGNAHWLHSFARTRTFFAVAKLKSIPMGRSEREVRFMLWYSIEAVRLHTLCAYSYYWSSIAFEYKELLMPYVLFYRRNPSTLLDSGCKHLAFSYFRCTLTCFIRSIVRISSIDISWTMHIAVCVPFHRVQRMCAVQMHLCLDFRHFCRMDSESCCCLYFFCTFY